MVRPGDMTTFSWKSSRPGVGSGTDVPITRAALCGLEVIARDIASAHYTRLTEVSHPNVLGYGAGIAHHLHSTNPEEWQRFIGDAIAVVGGLYGYGDKGMVPGGEKDSRQLFDWLHAFAEDLRNRS